jgi:hypothetical protein
LIDICEWIESGDVSASTAGVYLVHLYKPRMSKERIFTILGCSFNKVIIKVSRIEGAINQIGNQLRKTKPTVSSSQANYQKE